MTTTVHTFNDEQDAPVMMNPSPDNTDAEFGDEGSGATSGYGDADDLDELDDDMDDELQDDNLDDDGNDCIDDDEL